MLDFEQSANLEVFVGQEFRKSFNWTYVLRIDLLSLKYAYLHAKCRTISGGGILGAYFIFRSMLVPIRPQVPGLIEIGPAIGLELGVDIDLSSGLNFTYGAAAQVCPLFSASTWWYSSFSLDTKRHICIG